MVPPLDPPERVRDRTADAYCRPGDTNPGNPAASLFDLRCVWAETGGYRQLYVGVRLHVPGGETGAIEARLANAARVMEIAHLGPLTPVPLSGHPCLAQQSAFEGLRVTRRLCVQGNAAVVLYAAARDGDPFLEAASFFSSLELGPELGDSS